LFLFSERYKIISKHLSSIFDFELKIRKKTNKKNQCCTMRFSFSFLAILFWLLPQVAVSEDCELLAAPEPISRSLEGLASVMFEGFKPMIKRVEGSEPLIRILQYSVEPIISEVDGKLVVSSGTCTANEDTAVVVDNDEGETSVNGDGGETSVNGDGGETSVNGDSEDTAVNGGGEDTAVNGDGEDSAAVSTTRGSYLKLAASAGLVTTLFMDGGIATTGAIAGLLSLALPTAQAQEQTSACEQVVEVEIQTKSVGAVYMEDLLGWPDYDDEEDSYHWRPGVGDWPDRINASRTFRNSPSGAVYNYRNKVLMGMAQSSVLNQPPSVTAKEDVLFDIPTGIARPDTDEELMALSVLEMQGLLRDGQITSVELTNVALNMLDKYDPEFNMMEVDLRDLALRVAGEADALFANGTFVSAIQGIPFAIKDTYDVAGYATAYGSFEFMGKIR
jgi:hypothetical protein